jgi:hypothetical protein
MNDKVGIWIDHRKAVIVSASADRVTVRTLESQVGPHSRYSGRAGSPAPEGGEDEGGEKKYEKRYRQHLDRYYDAVISQLGHPEALLILGPGEAKLQLKERLSRRDRDGRLAQSALSDPRWRQCEDQWSRDAR